jgi:hypothetical protein
MLVNITQTDIDDGRPQCAGACPIANALHRLVGRRWYVAPHDLQGTRWQAEQAIPGGLKVDLPPEAARAARHYDLTGKMQPFSFVLDVEEKSHA